MGIAYNTSLITNGLIMYVDAANPRSYPGTGNTWYDLSGNNNHMTLVNGVTYSTASGGVLQTDGTNDYIELSPFDQRTTNHTIIGASRYTGSARGRIFSAINNNWLLGHWNNQNPAYYAEGWVVGPGSGNNNNWQISVSVENYSADTWSYYINGAFMASNNSGSQGPNGLSFGHWRPGGLTAELSTAEISFFMVYNRLLSATEIKQNYNATKKRFGL
jgi:hypothetical protein